MNSNSRVLDDERPVEGREPRQLGRPGRRPIWMATRNRIDAGEVEERLDDQARGASGSRPFDPVLRDVELDDVASAAGTIALTPTPATYAPNVLQ